MLAVRLPEDVEARLNKLAKETGRSKSWIVRDVIMERLADWEDFAIAEKRDLSGAFAVTFAAAI